MGFLPLLFALWWVAATDVNACDRPLVRDLPECHEWAVREAIRKGRD